MATFLAAYIVVWLGVAVFVARLGKRQRTLQQALDEIQEQIKRLMETEPLEHEALHDLEQALALIDALPVRML